MKYQGTFFFQKDGTNYQNCTLRHFYLIYKTLNIVTIVVSCYKILRKVC